MGSLREILGWSNGDKTINANQNIGVKPPLVQTISNSWFKQTNHEVVFFKVLTRGIPTSFIFGSAPRGGWFWPPCRFFICGRILMIFFLSTPHHVYSPKHISFFFYDHYDVRYGHFSTSGVSKNHVFSSFWLTAFLLDFCPTFFWSKIDAWDNSYWNYISPC